jgi:hypothetical protein
MSADASAVPVGIAAMADMKNDKQFGRTIKDESDTPIAYAQAEFTGILVSEVISPCPVEANRLIASFTRSRVGRSSRLISRRADGIHAMPHDVQPSDISRRRHH